jgi:hypothetical protein
MKTMNTLKVLSLMLLLAIWQPLSAQEALTTIRQSEESQEQISSPDNSSIKETYWMPSIVGRGIYYLGLVGINTTSPTHELHVVGSAYVSSLNINGQYNLPTTRATAGHYLNGLGEWTPMSIGGGTGFWQGLTGDKGIFYNGGLVGINIGADMPRYQLHVNGSVGVRSLEIIGQYSLPGKAGKEDEYLNGFGEWTPIEAGDSFWQGGIGTGIYFNRGAVGIGTTGANANASLQVVGNMNVGNNPHTGSIIGENAFVGGEESEASGQSAFSYGKLNQASGPFSIALGRESKALDHAAIALGYHAEAKVGNTIAIGKFVESTSSSAVTIGSGTGTGLNMLKNNFSHSLMLGFYSNVPTFFVGPSDGAGTTGSIGIGNMTDPQAKLHIYSDENKAATLKLEHRTTGKDRYAEIGLGTHSIRAGNTENMVFKTPSSRHFVFENGNVGIGVASPKAKLEVNGDILFTGQLFTDEGLYQSSLWEINGDDIYFSDGNVGIGVIEPTEQLDIKGNIKQTAGSSLTTTTIKAADINGLTLISSSGSGIFVADNGSVGIGTTNTFGNMLAVAGKVMATEVLIQHIDNWYDHVFSEDYPLYSIIELEKFITENRHLPDIPSEQTVKSEGIELSTFTGLLLKKIEELTLYTIEQQKQIEEQKKLLMQLFETVQNK